MERKNKTEWIPGAIDEAGLKHLAEAKKYIEGEKAADRWNQVQMLNLEMSINRMLETKHATHSVKHALKKYLDFIGDDPTLKRIGQNAAPEAQQFSWDINKAAMAIATHVAEAGVIREEKAEHVAR